MTRTACYQWQQQDLRLFVKVIARAKQTTVDKIEHGRLKIRLTAAPTDGNANQALVRLLADLFGVTQAAVTIQQGDTHREKTLLIHNPKQLPEFISESSDQVSVALRKN